MTFNSLNTPTAFLFFVAAVVTYHYSITTPGIRWFAYSAFCFFVVLGPFNWIGRSLTSSPGEDGDSLVPVGDLLKKGRGNGKNEKEQNKLRFWVLVAQGAVIIAGIGVFISEFP